MTVAKKNPLRSVDSRDRINPSELRVLIAILASIQFDGKAPTLREIAIGVGRSANSVSAIAVSLEKLVAMGLLERPAQANARAIRPKCRIEFFPESGLKKAS